MENLPKNWALSNIENAVEILDNRRKPVSASERAKRVGDVPYYGATGVAGSIDDFLFDEELVLLGEDGAPFLDFGKNVAYLISGKSWVNNHAHVLKAKSVTSNVFLLHYLNQFDYTNYVGGTTRLKLNQGYLKTIPFPLPPLPEKQRIVAKLDDLFGHLEQVKTRLEKIPDLLKNFRQAILTQAVTGKLTEEWRVGKELGNAFYLLSKIKKARENEYNTLCEVAKKEGTRKPKKPILEFELENNLDFDTPKDWIKCHIGDIGEVSNGSTPSRKINEYWNGEIPWVSSGLVQNGRIANTIEYITDLGYKNSSVSMLPVGTVLIAMIGEGKTRGQSAILDIEATTNQNLAAIKIDHGFVRSEFLQYWLKYRYEANRLAGSGTGPKALNGQKVRELDFILPPLEEQTEIVRRVESLFAKADVIEAKYNALKVQIDSLPQAILAKAFKGELVAQLESDGSAEELLKEIKKLKEESSRGKKKKKKSIKAY